MGGQTAINVCTRTYINLGILDKYNVEMIGAKPQSINLAEDREFLKKQ